MLSWIPLVGSFLSSFVAMAAFLFATVVGLTFSIATIGIAWVFYRPFMGISMLVLVSLSVYFIFYYE